jgi:Short C-terminal domain
MFLVPRQLRRSDFPSSVPYYGGRLTPQVIAGLQHPLRPDQSRQLATLDELHAQGVVTDDEYEEIRRRIVGGS